jgi:hypothetical protein
VWATTSDVEAEGGQRRRSYRSHSPSDVEWARRDGARKYQRPLTVFVLSKIWKFIMHLFEGEGGGGGDWMNKIQKVQFVQLLVNCKELPDERVKVELNTLLCTISDAASPCRKKTLELCVEDAPRVTVPRMLNVLATDDPWTLALPDNTLKVEDE